MTGRFALTRTTDTAERIIARFLGGADIAFASRREPFGRDPALSAAGEPVPDREGAGFVGVAHCPVCNVWADRLCSLCERGVFQHDEGDKQ